MTYSANTLEQREREKKALKMLLVRSFVASIALHIILLAYGVTNLVKRASLIAEQPIEITFIEPPLEEEVKPPLQSEITKIQTEKPQQKLKDTSLEINPNPGTNPTTIPPTKITQTKRVEASQRQKSASKIPIVPQKLSIQPQTPPINPQQTQTNSSVNNKLAIQQNSQKIQDSLAKFRDSRTSQNTSKSRWSLITSTSEPASQ